MAYLVITAFRGDGVKNPWEEIPLDDYENHMKLDSVMQLQAINEMMKGQFDAYPANSVMILGVAGGNGLEHAVGKQFETIYGVDVNSRYLQACEERYPDFKKVFVPICADLMDGSLSLPHSDMLIANLLIEYIGCPLFQRAVTQVNPHFISCILQKNTGRGFVSPSPYMHVFDGLELVYHPINEAMLAQAMDEIGYPIQKTLERLLPNGKSLVQIDFAR